jgi:hypothetical protein
MNMDIFNKHVERHFALVSHILDEGHGHEMFRLVQSDEQAEDVAYGLEAALRRGGRLHLLSENDLTSISACLDIMYWLGYQRAQRESALAEFQVAEEKDCE